MHSPLPDASALEAGILEDELPSRLSRVQDNVRNLLRSSRLGSIHSSPPATSPNPHDLEHDLETAPASATHQAQGQHPRVVQSPTADSVASTQNNEDSANDVPPSSYQHAVQEMAHQSAFFNSRALAALNHVNHPDLNHPSLAKYVRKHQKVEERQRRAWKRSKTGRKRSAAIELGSSQALLCIFAALMLAATVATYIVLATTSTEVTPTFHILFVLGIILATIVFAHSLIRLMLFSNRARTTRKAVVVSSTRQDQRRRHHHRARPERQQQRRFPVVTVDTTAFVPPTPIPVHMPSDEVRPDTREARPTTTIELSRPARSSWDKDVDTVPNPPPAYGRWRGSVRANPDLLHWQVLPSPVDARSPALPSPTYEDVIAEERTRPPSYVTRDSPARRPEVVMNRTEEATEAVRVPAPTVESEPEPEMVEVRGIGLGM